MNRAVLLTLSLMFLHDDCAGADGEVHLGSILDERIAMCGVVVKKDRFAVIEPILEARGDLEARLVLEVIKQSNSGASHSRQSGWFRNGRLDALITSMEPPADLTVVLAVSDRAGKPICEMRRSIRLENASTKI